MLRALAICCALAGCASAPPQTAGAAGANETLSAGPEYVIGPGDVLRVLVLGRPELSTELAVRPDGKISLPLVTDIDAVGITPTQLSHNLEERMQTYVLSPKVTVVVQQARSALNQVMVIGQVGKAGALPYRSGMTVLNAVLESNGLSQFAAGNRAVIIRTTNGTQNRIKIRLQDLMNRGDLQQNMLLRSGDVIVVPEARF